MDNIIKTDLLRKYRKASNKLILLDYDGTLVNYATIPRKASPPKKLLDILTKLTNKPKIKVIIISGRGYQDIDKFLGHLPIDIIAEHGAIIKINGKWKNQASDSVSWKKNILPILNQVTSECSNSIIEEKLFSLSWHYRNAESGYEHSRKLIGLLDNIIHNYKLKVLDGNQVVEIMSQEIGKGKAVKDLLEHNKYDYILSIGDDKTDEEMFEALMDNPNADTIKVGNGETFAKYKFDSVDKVLELLKQLSVCD
jgi:trehalose 6-phosphate synthase/phosphatase